MKFKTGDRIVLKDNDGMSAQIGATAVVQNPPYRGRFVNIAWERNSLCETQVNGGYLEECFYLLKERKEVVKYVESTPDGELVVLLGEEFSSFVFDAENKKIIIK